MLFGGQLFIGSRWRLRQSNDGELRVFDPVIILIEFKLVLSDLLTAS